MKVIFDNEKQKCKFFNDISISCPFYYGIDIDINNCTDCEKCWENTIEYEIKGEKE